MPFFRRLHDGYSENYQPHRYGHTCNLDSGRDCSDVLGVELLGSAHGICARIRGCKHLGEKPLTSLSCQISCLT